MTLTSLLAPLGADVVSRVGTAGDVPVSSVSYDSRRVGTGALFVALQGAQADGVTFARQAIDAGAVAVVADRPAPEPVTVPWIVVPDARVALGPLAAEFFGHPSREMTVVGVTGTNGKTTTTYLLAAIFESAGTPCGLMGTVAYRIGSTDIQATRTTPEAPDVQALLRDMVNAGCGACAMEVSSHALALHRVDGVRFGAAVFSNLTRDHLDFHQNMESYFAAKRRLFEMLPDTAPAVINLDDPRGSDLCAIVRHPVTYAITRTADVMPGAQTLTLKGLEFDVRTPQGTLHVRSPLLGKPNVYNILAATATATALGLPLEAVERGLAGLRGVPGRFELASGPMDDIAVLVDYAHTDDALRNLLETARPLAEGRLITVFGCGGDRDRTKRPLMGMVAARLSDVVIVTSDNPRSEEPMDIIEQILRGAQSEGRQSAAHIVSVVDRRDAIYRALTEARAGDLVLIAGKGHEKYQEVHGRAMPFDDVAVAREALASRLKSRAG